MRRQMTLMDGDPPAARSCPAHAPVRAPGSEVFAVVGPPTPLSVIALGLFRSTTRCHRCLPLSGQCQISPGPVPSAYSFRHDLHGFHDQFELFERERPGQAFYPHPPDARYTLDDLLALLG